MPSHDNFAPHPNLVSDGIGQAGPGGLIAAKDAGGVPRTLGAKVTGSLNSATVAIVDGSGNQITSFGGTSASVGATGSAVPTSAEYSGINVGGTLRGATASNPSGTIYAQNVDLASVAGTTTDTNSGTKSAGTLRVVLATDQPALTNKLLVTPDLPAGASTAANQTTMITHLSEIEGAVETLELVNFATDSTLQLVVNETAEANDHLQDIVSAVDGLETSNSAIQTATELLDDTVATLGTSTYTEATTKGLVIGVVRRDADTTLVNTTNEVGPLQMDANGRLKVEAFSGETLPVSFTGSGDVATQTTLASLLTSSQLIDDAIFTDDTSTHTTGTTKGVGIMAVATPTDTAVNANDIGMVAMTNNREQYVSLRDISGAAAVSGSGNATGALRVELANNGTGVLATVGTVTTVSTVSALGTGTTGPMKAEDVAHGTGDMGIPAWAVSNEGNTARAADGDYLPIAADTEGNVRVVGNRDHDAVDAGEPLKVGGQARTTNPAAVADGDRSNFITDKLGKQVVVGAIRDLKGVQQTTITSSTSETTIVTQVASTFMDLYGLVIANTSATATSVTIKDSTAGTTRFVFRVPAGDTRGFMVAVDSAVPQATVNTNWTATCADSVASIQVTALWVKNI